MASYELCDREEELFVKWPYLWDVLDAVMETRDTAPPWDRPLIEVGPHTRYLSAYT